MSSSSLLLLFKGLGGTETVTKLRRSTRHMTRKPRSIARDRRLGQSLQTTQWIGDGMELNTENRLAPNLSSQLTTNADGEIEIVITAILPVVDTVNIVKDPSDATTTRRIDVGGRGYR